MKSKILLVLLFWASAFIASELQASIVLIGSSYSENFDSLGNASGSTSLPAGWTGRSDASSSSLGVTSFSMISRNTWASSSGQFRNVASADGLTMGTSSADQNSSTDRAFGIRQTDSFGDPGAAFTLEIENTSGFQGFSFNFKSQLLDEEDRSTTWTVRFGTGDSPTTFTNLAPTIPDRGTFGSDNQSYSLPSSIDDSSAKLWIQIAALSDTTGSGSRDTFAIDDFVLNFSAVPEPTSAAMFVLAVSAIGFRRRRN